MKPHTTHPTNTCTAITHVTDTTPSPFIVGIDEVGRGLLFAHLSVAGVVLPSDLTGNFDGLDLSQSPLSTLNDSKQLSPKKRENLFTPIKQLACAYAIIDVPHDVIDEIDVYQATLLGMRLASEMLLAHYTPDPQNTKVLIDGNALPTLSADFAHYQSCLVPIIKGDATHSTIACASILAKVHRDRQMTDYDKKYPDYGLASNKGYASAKHRSAISELGVLPEHRRSFEPIKSLLQH